MAPRIIKKIEIFFLVLVALAFIVFINKYFHYTDFLGSQVIVISKNIGNYVGKKLAKCPSDQIKIEVTDGYLCRNNVEYSDWVKIYDAYPKSANGKEIIYRFIDEGDIDAAEKMLNDVYDIKRYDSVKITTPINWDEDPYTDKYWRFNFYSLRPLSNLLFASAQSKQDDNVYANKLSEIVSDFIDNGMDKEYSWDDNHAVAFRTMTLIDIWWKLRERNALTIDLSTKILRALEEHGKFLADKNHYDSGHNHGINESAALFLLATNFPDMQDSNGWLSLSKERLSAGLNKLVDDDGVLIENSPFYHFYALEKYWEILKYTKNYKIFINDDFDNKIHKMINYATYILQPDLSVPLISASTQRKFVNSGIYKEIAQENPSFLYVLTTGKQGKVPPEKNLQLLTAGQTIMRSGWGVGNEFGNQTQLTYNVGSYRTTHSHLDALSFTLFGAGIPLIVDSGLYTYEHNPLRNYFYGTGAHNTVVVDGADQNKGKVNIGESISKDDFFYQSAESNLYAGVKHKRATALIGKNIALVIDQLKSDQEHTYSQKFHLSPDLKVQFDGLAAIASDNNNQQKLSITQLIPDGINVDSKIGQQDPPDGLCSYEYGKTVPCESISYTKKGNSASYISLLEVGPHNENLKASVSQDGKEIDVDTGDKKYTINIENTEPVERKVDISNQDLPQTSKNDLGLFNNLQINTPINGSTKEVIKNVKLDLSNNNISFQLKVDNISSLDTLELALSNDNWKTFAINDLKNIYRTEYNNEWLTISLGKGFLRDNGGAWAFNDKAFDWSKIDKIKFIVSSNKGESGSAIVNNFSTFPEQSEGVVSMVFDDGSESVLDAADAMKQYGYAGTTAVISDRPSRNVKGYLSLNELKYLQNTLGWNIANHSFYHQNAIEEYISKNNISGLEDDILRGAKYLTDNNINSAPNWYIYPNGATNDQVESIVGKYYKEARTTQGSPEVFPYGDNLRVKNFEVTRDVSPEHVIKAIKDAMEYKLTLILTFHKLQTKPEDITGKTEKDLLPIYRIEDFKNILEGIKNEGIGVKTLSELDDMNGIKLQNVKITDKFPEQIKLDVTSNSNLNNKKYVILNLWEYLINFGKKIFQSLKFIQH